jgi:hypothetical protein
MIGHTLFFPQLEINLSIAAILDWILGNTACDGIIDRLVKNPC